MPTQNALALLGGECIGDPRGTGSHFVNGRPGRTEVSALELLTEIMTRMTHQEGLEDAESLGPEFLIKTRSLETEGVQLDVSTPSFLRQDLSLAKQGGPEPWSR